MDRFDRIFELNRILQHARRPVPRQALEEALECSRATVKRIIEDMRIYLNAPIVYDRERNGYRYERDQGQMYELPGLWFNASELHALLVVQQLLRDLRPGLLEGHLRPLEQRVEALLELRGAGAERLAGRVIMSQVGARTVGEHFKTVATALTRQVKLKIRYHSRNQNITRTRVVSPQRIVYHRDNWYLDAWCHLRDGLRTFAIDAIRDASLEESGAFRCNDRELDQHYAASYGIFAGDPTQIAVMCFEPARARWVANEFWHRDQSGRYLDDGCYELRVPYSDASELVMDILRYGPDVEVIAPQALRDEVAARLAAALDRYRLSAVTTGSNLPLPCKITNR